jgi:hypothetical protein
MLLLIQAGASLGDIMMDKGQSACLCRLGCGHHGLLFRH